MLLNIKKLDMKHILIFSLLIVILSCNDAVNKPNSKSTQKPTSSSVKQNNDETLQMVQELKALVDEGHPKDYYHWNKKQAELLLSQINVGSPQQQINTWFAYCKQSLYAGKSQVCID